GVRARFGWRLLDRPEAREGGHLKPLQGDEHPAVGEVSAADPARKAVLAVPGFDEPEQPAGEGLDLLGGGPGGHQDRDLFRLRRGDGEHLLVHREQLEHGGAAHRAGSPQHHVSVAIPFARPGRLDQQRPQPLLLEPHPPPVPCQVWPMSRDFSASYSSSVITLASRRSISLVISSATEPPAAREALAAALARVPSGTARWTASGCGASRRVSDPVLPADSMWRSPAPTSLRTALCRVRTSVIRSSGMAEAVRPTRPERRITRPVVTAYSAVSHVATARAGQSTKATAAALRMAANAKVPHRYGANRTAVAAAARITAPCNAGLARPIQWGRSSTTRSSSSPSRLAGKRNALTPFPSTRPPPTRPSRPLSLCGSGDHEVLVRRDPSHRLGRAARPPHGERERTGQGPQPELERQAVLAVGAGRCREGRGGQAEREAHREDRPDAPNATLHRREPTASRRGR